MKKIFKYSLDILDKQTVWMPIGATVLSIQYQHGVMVIWALVDPSANTEPRPFYIFGTGQPIEEPERLQFLATAQHAGGQFVWHIFEPKRN